MLCYYKITILVGTCKVFVNLLWVTVAIHCSAPILQNVHFYANTPVRTQQPTAYQNCSLYLYVCIPEFLTKPESFVDQFLLC